MNKDNVQWLYYGIDIIIFILLIVIGVNWIIALVVSGIVGFALIKLDPLSKMIE